jgi:hypothetical protein
MPGSTTTTTMPGVHCPPSHHHHKQACFCVPHLQSHRGKGPFPSRFCKHHDDRHRDACPCDAPRHRHDGGFGSQGDPGSPGYNATDARSLGAQGQQLPDAGLPPAAPLMAICGFVIVVAGTVLRRIVLHVPA